VYFEQGLNKVAVMVHGPQECRNKAKLDTLEEGKVLVVPVSALLCVAVCYLR
jgi:ribonuclease PH